MSQRTVRPFAEQGHFTPMHNTIWDQVMPLLSDSAWKVLCLFVRKTSGFNRKNDALAYPDIKDGTGIKSNTTIAKVLAELMNKETFGSALILSQKAPARGIATTGKTKYALNLNFTITVQKMDRKESNDYGPENGPKKNHYGPENGPCFGPENGPKISPPVISTCDLTETIQNNNSLSAREDAEVFPENIEPENLHRPFDEGKDDPRYYTPHFFAVSEVCELDLDIVSWKTKSTAGYVAVQLSAKYSPDEILRCKLGDLWDLPSVPHPRQLLDRIQALLRPKGKARAAPKSDFAKRLEERKRNQNQI